MSLLRGREHRQGGLGTLVEIAAATFQAVVAAAGRGVEHRCRAVVVTKEPVPGEADAHHPAWLPRDPERARAGIGERGHLDGLLVVTGADVVPVAAAHWRYRQVAVASLGAQQELQEGQAMAEGRGIG